MKFRINIFLYILVVIVACVSCKKETYDYLSYEADRVYIGKDFSLQDDEFVPGVAYIMGDTLIVANNAEGKYSLIVYNIAKDQLIKTISTWKKYSEGETDVDFKSSVEAICVQDDLLFASICREARIHVYKLPSLEYACCIGNGRWQDHVFESSAICSDSTYLYVRDKSSQISIYKMESIRAAIEDKSLSEKVNRFKRSGAGGSSNNGWAPCYMYINEEGNIVVNDYDTKKIRVLDKTMFRLGFADGTMIDIEDKTIPTEFGPKTMAVLGDYMYVTGSNDLINIYDMNTKTWRDDAFKKVNSFAFSRPVRVLAQSAKSTKKLKEDCLWVSDDRGKALVLVKIYKGKITETSKKDLKALE